MLFNVILKTGIFKNFTKISASYPNNIFRKLPKKSVSNSELISPPKKTPGKFILTL